jgi:hypothetical protein
MTLDDSLPLRYRRRTPQSPIKKAIALLPTQKRSHFQIARVIAHSPETSDRPSYIPKAMSTTDYAYALPNLL